MATISKKAAKRISELYQTPDCTRVSQSGAQETALAVITATHTMKASQFAPCSMSSGLREPA
jgi:hypothetical protein